MTVEEERTRSAGRAGTRSADRPRSDPWKVAFVTLLVVAVLAVVIWVLLGSRLLVVRQVEVNGLGRLTETEVVAALDVTTGTPLARVDTGAAEARVTQLRLAESAEVSRGWPATLVVEVVERTPVVSIQAEHGYLLVDREGVRVEDSDTRPPGYPLVRIKGEVQDNPAIAETAQIIKELPGPLRDEVDTVEATDRATITLGLSGGATVVWGDAERGDQKARVLHVLMRQHPVKPGLRYDVSAPGVAVVK